MQLNSIKLDAEVDVNSLCSIHSDQDIKFSRKNSIVYQDMLGNYRAVKGDGWFTTTGRNIKPTSVDSGTVSFNDGQFASTAEYVVTDMKELELPLSGTIQNEPLLFMDSEHIYYQAIIKQNDALYHCLYDGAKWTITRLYVSEAFTLDGPYYIIANSNTSYTVIHSVTQGLVKSITISGAPSKANNGRYLNVNNNSTFYIGRDDDNQKLAWHAVFSINDSSANAVLYMGSIENISGKVVVTGEPYYRGASVTELGNGVLKWQVNTMACQASVNTFSSSLSKELPGSYDDINACTGDKTADVLSGPFGSYCSSCLVSRVTYTGRSASYSNTPGGGNSVILNDPNMSPGNFWGTATAYESSFPFNYMFSNIATNRGSTFDYGKGWNISLSEKVEPRVCSVCDKLSYPVLGYCPLQYIVNTECYYLDNTVDNNSSCCDIPFSPVTNEIVYKSEDTTYHGDRWRLVGYSTKENKAWTDFYHSIGGRNSGDESVIDSIPFSFNDGKFDRIIYNGLLSGIVLDGVLLNSTSSTAIEHFSWAEYGDFLYVLINNRLSVLKKNYSLKDVRIKKISNYIFTTNLAGYYNTFIESKDGKIDFVNSYVPYSQTFRLNNVFQSQGYFSPTSSTNDIWYQAAGYNTNVKDSDRVTSYILPGIEIPVYVYSGNLDDFNKKIVDNNQPLLSLDRSYMDSRSKIDVYYTHSLASTDLTYKYSDKDNTGYFDKELKDNTWITTADLYLYPLGLLSEINGENNIMPTVVLDDKYSVRLYSNNNTVYMAFNPTQAVFQSNEIFTIYTSSYYFDGQAIYYIGGVNDNTSNSFVCYALGMRFLGNSGTEAFFYSEYDRSIYLFSGSNTLTLYKAAAQINDIIDTCYSSCDQALYLLTDIGLLVIKAQTSALFNVNGPDHLELTTKGVVVYSKDGSYTLYSPSEGELQPFELETEWIGDPNRLFTFGFAEIWLYKKASPITLKAILSTQADNDTTDDIRTVTIKPSDFKGLNYRLRLTPKNTKGNAFKLYISSPCDISITNIALAVDENPGIQAARHG